MGSLIGGGKGGGGDSLDFAEIEQATRQQQRMNNPNYSNAFGTTNTTFGADDQASIVQQMSPEMQGLYNQALESVQGGPNQYTPQSNSFNQQMMQNFNQNMANRSGFQAPQRQWSPTIQNKEPVENVLGMTPPQPSGGGGGYGTPFSNPVRMPDEYNIPATPKNESMQDNSFLNHLGGSNNNQLMKAILNKRGY